jgi:uncharacterized membrane-anchored protein
MSTPDQPLKLASSDVTQQILLTEQYLSTADFSNAQHLINVSHHVEFNKHLIAQLTTNPSEKLLQLRESLQNANAMLDMLYQAHKAKLDTQNRPSSPKPG